MSQQTQASQFTGVVPDDSAKAKSGLLKQLYVAVGNLLFGSCPGDKFYTENRDKAFHFKATNFLSR